jgi:uncharacterized membrane protein YgcG
MKKSTIFLLLILSNILSAKESFNGGGTGRKIEELLINNHLVDQTGVLSTNERNTIENRLQVFLKQKNIKFSVVLVDTFQENLVEIATKLGSNYVINDNYTGIVFVVSVKDRKMFLSPSSSLQEKLTDLYCGRLLDNTIQPYFKANMHYDGILRLIDEMERQNFDFLSDHNEDVLKNSEQEIKKLKSGLVTFLTYIGALVVVMGMLAAGLSYMEGNIETARIAISCTTLWIILLTLLKFIL